MKILRLFGTDPNFGEVILVYTARPEIYAFHRGIYTYGVMYKRGQLGCDPIPIYESRNITPMQAACTIWDTAEQYYNLPTRKEVDLVPWQDFVSLQLYLDKVFESGLDKSATVLTEIYLNNDGRLTVVNCRGKSALRGYFGGDTQIYVLDDGYFKCSGGNSIFSIISYLATGILSTDLFATGHPDTTFMSEVSLHKLCPESANLIARVESHKNGDVRVVITRPYSAIYYIRNITEDNYQILSTFGINISMESCIRKSAVIASALTHTENDLGRMLASDVSALWQARESMDYVTGDALFITVSQPDRDTYTVAAGDTIYTCKCVENQWQVGNREMHGFSLVEALTEAISELL